LDLKAIPIENDFESVNMTLRKIIKDSGVADTILKYQWDDWEPEKAWEPINEELEEKLGQVSDRANAAFCIACAEWIVERFSLLDNDPMPSQFLEASWVAMINFRYRKYYEPSDDEWQGPVRGVLGVTVEQLADVTLRATDGDYPSVNAASVAGLAEYVLNSPDSFLIWRDWAVERLINLYPLIKNDTLGDVVPQEIFDPKFDFSKEQTECLIQSFLVSLDHTKNPFLRTPEEMIQDGFEGESYVFNIQEDDQDRF